MAHGLSIWGPLALEHRLSSCGIQVYLLFGMGDLPRLGIKLISALAGRFFTTELLGKPKSWFKKKKKTKIDKLLAILRKKKKAQMNKIINERKKKVKLLSHLQLFVTPWTVAYQGPLSMGFSRQEYWSGLPFPSPGDLPNPGIDPRSPALGADVLPSEPPGKPK